MILTSINKHWAWTGLVAKQILHTNEFGHIIFLSESGEYWRMSAEELYCKVIADNSEELEKLMLTKDFIEGWEMKDYLKTAKEKLGELQIGEKYCLKLPLVLGGEFSEDNYGTILQIDQISYAGQLTAQIDDLPDGTKIEFNV